MHLSRFPRLRLGHLETPLEKLPRLSERLGIELWIKRDDCTGLATGGNKTRKLEFLMAEALEQGCDMVMTQGAVQSNHARQTAAAAARLGLGCHLLLEERVETQEESYHRNGNVFLDLLHGASCERRGPGLDMAAELETAAQKARGAGARVYVIPGGGSNPTGALGYVNCAFELLQQANDRQLRIDRIVHATGSAGTQAGLVVGLKATHADIPLLGIGVRAGRDRQEDMVFRLACATADKLGCTGIVSRSDVQADCDYVGEGYGLPTPGTIEAIELFARLEGILLDPVYSGKAAAGLIGLVKSGQLRPGERVVFIHTGGVAGLFGYPWAFGYGDGLAGARA